MQQTVLTLEDFAEGLFIALPTQNCFGFEFKERALHRALASAYNRLRTEHGKHVTPDFHIYIDDKGQSEKAHELLAIVKIKGLINSLQVNSYKFLYLQVDDNATPDRLRKLPGRPEMYHDLAQTFCSVYSRL